ncbi:MAG: NAD/FAD-binding protein, partial [Betaproteobacteria bacterium]|nr:NAD/FAD-binding protein [Betaproteobacteria bacterium]
TFSLALESPAIEWSGSNLDTLFAQRRNLLRPSFLRMLRDVLRFNREAAQFATEHAVASPEAPLSLGQFLSQGRYSDEFRDWYLGPMAAAIWSCPTRAMLEFPFASFAQFFRNHGLLQISDRPQWFTVPGGARQYVERLIAALQARGGQLRLNTPVRAVSRDLQGSAKDTTTPNTQGAIRLRCDHGAEHFDALVLACHSDQSLALLGEQASTGERAVLSGIPYQANRALLHTDSSLLPARQKLWSAWNYSAGRDGPDGRPVAVHYLLNKLQPLPFTQPLLVSLNPHREPHPDSVLGEYDYAHPVFGANAAQAQALLPGLQGQHQTWFCGAWTRYGFHEDGLRSAVAVARDF